MIDYKDLEQIDDGNIMLVFSTSWCPDCIVLSNYIDKVVEVFSDKWTFIYVDRDENLDLARSYNVFGIPSFVALKDGIKVADYISTDSKSFEDVVNFINSIN